MRTTTPNGDKQLPLLETSYVIHVVGAITHVGVTQGITKALGL